MAMVSRTKPPEQRRADLLAAGQSLFIAKGIGATSLEDITKRAGVSKGLFYLYFHSKEDLVVALQEQFSHQFADRIRAAAAAQTDWAAKLDACVQASFECYRDLSELHEVLFRHAGHPDSAAVDAEHEPAHALHAQTFRQVLDDGVAAGAFEVEDTETTAVLFYVTMHAFDPSFHGGHPPSDTRLLRATQQLFRRAAGAGS
jgi:TetR/AcrR family transcriptional repressor of nem operon